MTMRSQMRSQKLGSRIVALITALTILLLPMRAMADCYTLDKAPPDASCVVMNHGEARGVWFTLKLSQEFKEMKQKVPELEAQIMNLQLWVQHREKQVDLYKGITSELQETLVEERKAGALIVKAKRRAINERDESRAELGRWYRSPWLWMGVGVVATVATGVGIHFLTTIDD